jgi:hypothetical protein
MTSHAVASIASRVATRRWATAAIADADAADTTPMELDALGAHVDRCNGSRGRMFALQCAAESFLGFIAPRFITTAVIVAIVFGVASLVV